MKRDLAWRRFGPLAGVMGVVATAACHTMQPIQPTQLTSSNVEAVWVTGTDRTTVVLHAPHVTGDTLAGFVDGEYREMLLSQTGTIRARAAAPGRTAAVGIVAGATALVAFVYMANRTYVGDGQTCYTGRDGTVVPCCAGKSTISC